MVYDRGRKIYDVQNCVWQAPLDVPPSGNPVNDCLKLLGVHARAGLDEWDTIDLRRFRCNDDFAEEAEQIE